MHHALMDARCTVKVSHLGDCVSVHSRRKGLLCPVWRKCANEGHIWGNMLLCFTGIDDLFMAYMSVIFHEQSEEVPLFLQNISCIYCCAHFTREECKLV